jgi:hypothetical protein
MSCSKGTGRLTNRCVSRTARNIALVIGDHLFRYWKPILFRKKLVARPSECVVVCWSIAAHHLNYR